MSNQTVLVIDDTKTIVRVALSMLNESGYDATGVFDTIEALIFLKENPVDIIFCDVEITPLNGYAFCQVIKEEPSLMEIPVVFVSSRTGALDKARAREVGGVEFVTKPFAKQEILHAIESHLGVTG